MFPRICFAIWLCLVPASWASGALVSHWALDETSGTVASNEVIGRPSGQVGGSLVWAGGPVDGAAEFNGTNTRIYIPSTVAISGHWTWAMWLRVDSIATNYDSFLSTNAWALGAGMHGVLRSNGAFAVGLNTGGADDQTQSQGTVPVGIWTHIAWTYDAGAEQARFYINGVLDVVRAVDNPIAMTLGPCTLGAWNNGGTYQRWLDGGLDDVRIYNATLAGGDIQALYLGPTRATHPDPFDGHPGVDPEAILGWQAPEAFPAGATYNVYFGDAPGSLALVSSAQAGTSYDPSLLAGTEYWWRIDVIGPDDTVYTGALWSFTTLIVPEGCYEYPAADIDGDCDVDTDDLLEMVTQWMDCGKVAACVTDGDIAGYLLAHWRFDNTLANETGSGLDGVGVPVSPVYAAGMDGQAVDLQGVNGVEIPEIATGDAFTVAFWVNFNSFDAAGVAMPIISTTVSASEPLYGAKPNGALAQAAVGLSVSLLGAGATFATGEWYHYAGVYNQGSGTLDVYIDGRWVSTYDVPGEYPLTLGPWMLGAWNNDGAAENFLDGKLDDLRVYGHSLSAVQVATLYAVLRPGEVICATTLSADINGDCVVDFDDFSMFTSGWLDCRIVPDCMALP